MWAPKNNIVIASATYYISNFSEDLNSQNEPNSARAIAVNQRTSEASELHSKQKYPIKGHRSDSLDNSKTYLNGKTKEEPFDVVGAAKLTEQISEPELLIKSENVFGEKKAGNNLDDEASLLPDTLATKSNSHKCNKCDRVFQRKRGLRDHHLSHSNVRKFKCTLCDVKFKSEDSLKAHRRRHNGERKYNCEMCDKRFFTSTEAKCHQRTHTGEKPYVCIKCGRGFTACGDLCRHMQRHDNTRTKVCKVCGKNFYNNNLLKNHMAVHSDERPFACTCCPSTFSRKSTLQEHMKLHVNAKEYECNFCEKSFNQKPSLVGHMKKNHEDIMSHWQWMGNTKNS